MNTAEIRENIIETVLPRVMKNNEENYQKIKDNDLFFTTIADLIVCYYIQFKDSFCLTNAILKSSGIEPDELEMAAKKNIAAGTVTKTLNGVVASIIGSVDESVDDVTKEVLVISYCSGYLGAGVIVTKELANYVSDKYYIVPSSIHELLLFPKNIIELEDLREMVADVNREQVAPKDRLSDNVYVISDGNLIVA